MARSTWLSPPQIASELGIDAHKPLSWIMSGELVAVNLAERRGGRPRYRVSREALDAFLAGRRVTPPAPQQRRRARPSDVPEYV